MINISTLTSCLSNSMFEMTHDTISKCKKIMKEIFKQNDFGILKNGYDSLFLNNNTI